jgi:cation diffusion facilitator family transporter
MKEKIAKISILANVILAGVKITVGIFSNSASVLAEGVHSLMDVFSSLISFFGIKISKKPADKKHPYGHFKFEVLAGFLITLIFIYLGKRHF